MTFLRKIAASFFASAAFTVLSACGWKRKTVEANLKHVSQGTWGALNLRENSESLYRRMLRNMARHVGELLFCFDTYKDLPEDPAQYPCKKGRCIFEIAASSETVIEKMRGGGIFLTAHYGNYEASGAWLCALNVPLKASFIPLKPPWLNRIVYEKIRCVKGRPYSIDAKTPREFLAQLDGTAPDCRGQKQLFCLLADQDSRIGSALDGTFLGQPVKVNPLPDFLLKHRPGTPVFFCWIEELGKRRETKNSSARKILHAVEVESANPVVDGPYRHWLESRIKENPALWYGWTHRRFKSKNPGLY